MSVFRAFIAWLKKRSGPNKRAVLFGVAFLPVGVAYFFWIGGDLSDAGNVLFLVLLPFVLAAFYWFLELLDEFLDALFHG